MSQSTPETPRLTGDLAVCSTDLLAAVALALEEWAWIQAGTRQPLSIVLRRPENELKVFKMVVSMNNLKRRYEKWKAANAKVRGGANNP